MRPLTVVPRMDTLALVSTVCLGASLRDRATLSSPLRGLAPSGGYPSRLRSLRSLRAPLARRLAALAAAAARRRSSRSRPGSTASSAGPPRPPRAGASRRARRGPRRARPGRLRRLRASLRLRPGALRALAGAGFAAHRSPHCARQLLPAPSADRSRHRLRQRAAHDCLRLRPHRPPPNAAAASTGEDRRRRFPYRECRPMRSLWTAGRLILHHPTQRAARGRMRAPGIPSRGLPAPLGAIIRPVLLDRACNAPDVAERRLLTAPAGVCRRPLHNRLPRPRPAQCAIVRPLHVDPPAFRLACAPIALDKHPPPARFRRLCLLGARFPPLPFASRPPIW